MRSLDGRPPVPWPHSVRIDDSCTACGLCLQTCPEQALVRAPQRPAVLDAWCTGCLACVEVCPRDSIIEWRAADAVPVRSHPISSNPTGSDPTWRNR